MIIVLNFAKNTLNLAKWAVGLVYLVSGDIRPDFAGYLLKIRLPLYVILGSNHLQYCLRVPNMLNALLWR